MIASTHTYAAGLLLLVVSLLFAVPAVGEENQAVMYVAAHDSSAAAREQAAFVCDGSDDQVEIQKALFAIPAGGTVVLAAGTYRCNTMILPKANTTLKGEGAQTTFLEFRQSGRIRVDQEGVTAQCHWNC